MATTTRKGSDNKKQNRDYLMNCKERNAELREGSRIRWQLPEVGIISRWPTDARRVLGAIVESASVCGIDDVGLRLQEGGST